MITVAKSVEEIIQADDLGLEALRAGILNLSAYAQKILPLVEEQTMKPVELGTIVVALSRISANTLEAIPPLKPDVHIQDMSIKTPLCELTFERTMANSEKLSKLPKAWFYEEFFTVTQGLGEVTIICLATMKEKVLQHFFEKPKGIYNNLVAVTIRFKEEGYIEEPNMIFTLVSALASKRINLIEIVSTFTEISFIVRDKEMNQTVQVLQRFF